MLSLDSPLFLKPKSLGGDAALHMILIDHQCHWVRVGITIRWPSYTHTYPITEEEW